MNTDGKIKYIARHYGLHNQAIKLGEELGELFQSVSGYIDGRFGIESIEEEVADVYVMINQICYLTGTNKIRILAMMEEKLDRQMRRIEKEVSKSD